MPGGWDVETSNWSTHYYARITNLHHIQSFEWIRYYLKEPLNEYQHRKFDNFPWIKNPEYHLSRLYI